MSKYGIYAIGDSITTGTMNSIKDIVHGVRFRFKWAQVETADGVYDFTYIKAQMDVVYNADKYIWLQFNISPCKDASGSTPADYNCPQYLFAAPYNVPKVYTSTVSAPRFFPYYLDTNFKAKHRAFLEAVIAWIATLPAPYQAKIILLLSSEGKTGDSGPYSGTVVNSAYAISDTNWDEHKRSLWSFTKGKIDEYGLGLKFMINQGNDGNNFQWGLDNIDECSFKSGDNSHNFDYAGSSNSAQRFLALRDPSTAGDYANVFGGEFENTDEQSYYTSNPDGYLLPFFCFNLHCNIQIINLAPSIIRSNRFTYQIFNEFAEFRNISEADRGLILFRDKPDFNDTVRFPEGIYGTVVDPSRLSGSNGYTQKYNSIINSTKPDAVKADNITTLRIQYINPARISAIVAELSSANYITLTSDRDYDAKNSDFGFDVVKGNFERYLHMYDQFGTSESAWRTNFTGAHGRYALRLTDVKPKWYFHTPVMVASDYQVQIKVVYSNLGTGSWELLYYNGIGKVSAGVVTCTNTDVWIEKVFTITHFNAGRKLAIPATTDKCDFTIEKVGTGSNVDFSMMRIYRIAENSTPPSNTPPVAISAASTYNITLPVNFVDLDFTASNDPDGTIVGRTLTRISGPTTFLPINPGSATPRVSELIVGTYVFRHTVTDNDGATDYVDVTINVAPEVTGDPQPPLAIITPPEAVVLNEPATFSSSASFDNDGTIAARQWSITGPTGATIDNDTAEDINVTVTQQGRYVLTLIVTDDDDLTDETTYQFDVFPPDTTPATNFGLPKLEFLDFIANKDNQTAAIENGVVVFNAVPTPFRQHADGWKDVTIAFGTNEKYFALNRSFSLPLKFVGDAAQVLRTRSYKFRGYEEELYYLLFKWNRNDGKHYLEYKGKIDMSKKEDRPLEGFTVNTIEGGILSYLNANDGKTYEIAGDETNPDIFKLLFDGINLFDKYNYSLVNIDLFFRGSTVPCIFLNNEGDSVGIIKGDQQYEEIPNTGYYTDSANFLFQSPLRSITLTVAGTFNFGLQDGIPIGAGMVVVYIALRTDLGQEFFLIGNPVGTGENHDFIYVNKDYSFSQQITLAANEKLFLVYATTDITSVAKINDSTFNISFISKNGESLVYSDTLWGLFKKLFYSVTENKFNIDSTYFKTHDNIAAFCGDALRNTSRTVVPYYKFATTLADCFKALNSFHNLGMKIVDDVLYLEPKRDIYNDTNNVLLDLGEVVDLVIRHTEERLVNTISCGFNDQDYGQRNGKYEFNTSRQYGLPTTAVQRAYDITCPYRGDAFGQEFIRDVLENKDTTDNTGDKSVFIAVIDDNASEEQECREQKDNEQVYESGDQIIFETQIGTGLLANSDKDEFTFNDVAQTTRVYYYFRIDNGGSPVLVELTKNGTTIDSYFIAAATGNDLSKTVYNVPLVPGDVLALKVTNPGSTLTSTIEDAQLSVFFTTPVYNLKRYNYDSLSGVLDDTIYNDDLSPLKQLLAHGDYLKGLLNQQLSQQITFQTGQKNINFDRTINGVRYQENANIPVSSLMDNFFIDREAEFKAKSPYTFAETLSKMNAGLIKFTYNGNVLYALPIGEMSAKPASDEPQTWKVLLHKNTSLTTLLMLGSPGTFIGINDTKMIFITDLNPVHFVKYNYEPDAKYHHKDMYDDWVHQRHDRFASQPAYLQKWQKNDTINLQIITSGLGQVEVYVYDRNAAFVQSYSFVYGADNAVLFPATKQQVSIPLTDYPEGEYLMVIRTNTTNLAISEWLYIKESHDDTYLFDYYHSENKLDAYFGDWRPSLRCEAFFHEWQPDSSFVTYEDEPADLEMLRGRPYMKRIIALGGALGIPEWLANKLNQILLLNRLSIEGVRYTRNADSKFEAEERQGHPLNFYRLEIRKALNDTGLTVDDTGAEVINGITAYTLDAKAFGRNGEVITITTRNE